MLNKTTWPLLSLNKRRNQINTNPDYQRPSVWTKNQKQLLIDSILHDYDIPKIYLHEVEKNKYDVVDGQQRIRAIWSFYDDEYPLAKDADPINEFEVAGKKYSELEPEVSDIIDTYNLDPSWPLPNKCYAVFAPHNLSFARRRTVTDSLI